MNIQDFYNIRVGDRVVSSRPFPTQARTVVHGFYNHASDGQDNPHVGCISGSHVFAWEVTDLVPFDPEARLPRPHDKFPHHVGEPAFAWAPAGGHSTYQDYLKVCGSPTPGNLKARLEGLYQWLVAKPEKGRPYWPRWWKMLRMAYELHRGDGHHVTWQREGFACTCGASANNDPAHELGVHLRVFDDGRSDIIPLRNFNRDLIRVLAAA